LGGAELDFDRHRISSMTMPLQNLIVGATLSASAVSGKRQRFIFFGDGFAAFEAFFFRMFVLGAHRNRPE
jgi:hypothetical protein